MDRAEILRLHGEYLDANTRFDWEQLRSVFSARDDTTLFNLNGFTYRGRAHWIRLWQYYATQVQSTYWTPYDIGGVVGAETAVVWCHRRCRRQWVGSDQPVTNIHYDNGEFISRSTMVFRREAEGWRVMHVHFSRAEDGARPGGI